jgi:hypothetical protein
MGTIALEVEPFPHAGPGKNVVASLRPHPEALRLEQMAKLLKADIGIRLPAEQLLDGLGDAHQRPTLKPEPGERKSQAKLQRDLNGALLKSAHRVFRTGA